MKHVPIRPDWKAVTVTTGGHGKAISEQLWPYLPNEPQSEAHAFFLALRWAIQTYGEAIWQSKRW